MGTALVTGATRGIGHEIARELSAHMDVVRTGRAPEHGRGFIAFDQTSDADIERVATWLEKAGRRMPTASRRSP